jgi:mono/diheme cytochrome c family protein
MGRPIRVLCGALSAAALWLGLVAGSGVGVAADGDPGGDPARGENLYLRYCQGCHGKDGRGGGHTFMPHVDRLTEKGYIDLLPDEYLYQVITEGGQVVGKSGYMPAWKSTLSDQDVHDVIAHIRRFRLH